MTNGIPETNGAKGFLQKIAWKELAVILSLLVYIFVDLKTAVAENTKDIQELQSLHVEIAVLNENIKTLTTFLTNEFLQHIESM